MILRREDYEEKAMPEFKGGIGELNARMITDENGKILFGRLKPGNSIGLHTHDTSSEIIYILEGEADYIYDGKEEKAVAGNAHYCPKGHSHCMINNGDKDLVFFAVIPEQ